METEFLEEKSLEEIVDDILKHAERLGSARGLLNLPKMSWNDYETAPYNDPSWISSVRARMVLLNQSLVALQQKQMIMRRDVRKK